MSVEQETTLFVPIQRQGTRGFQSLRRQLDGLSAGKYHLRDVRGEEGKRQVSADMRDLLPIPPGNRGDGGCPAGAQVFKPAMAVADEVHEFGIG